jgi:8-oxo-dGTP diphosphatase
MRTVNSQPGPGRSTMAKRAKAKYTYDYPRPAVTVDIVVLSSDRDPQVLLVRRKQEPFAGSWAIPGGFIDMEETLESAARRELLEETGLKAAKLIQVKTFGDPDRDPRGRTISVVYLTHADRHRTKPRAADDAAQVGWHSLRRPPKLAFDHARILDHIRRLQRSFCE